MKISCQNLIDNHVYLPLGTQKLAFLLEDCSQPPKSKKGSFATSPHPLQRNEIRLNKEFLNSSGCYPRESRATTNESPFESGQVNQETLDEFINKLVVAAGNIALQYFNLGINGKRINLQVFHQRNEILQKALCDIQDMVTAMVAIGANVGKCLGASAYQNIVGDPKSSRTYKFETFASTKDLPNSSFCRRVFVELQSPDTRALELEGLKSRAKDSWKDVEEQLGAMAILKLRQLCSEDQQELDSLERDLTTEFRVAVKKALSKSFEFGKYDGYHSGQYGMKKSKETKFDNWIYSLAGVEGQGIIVWDDRKQKASKEHLEEEIASDSDDGLKSAKIGPNSAYSTSHKRPKYN